MASLDPAVARVLDNQRSNATDSDDEDALIAALEDDTNTFDAFREQRLQQLHSEMTREKAMRSSDHGKYQEVKDEKEVMDITTSTRLCVVHFFKDGFARCGVMDQEIEKLAPKHFDTRFLRINVDNAPFLVTKLRVQVLPCVIAFIDGQGVDRIIGFEGLSAPGSDKFTTRALEARLLSCGVLTRAKLTDEDERQRQYQQKKREEDDYDDDDWD